jgi:hypothetical protein
MMMGTGAEISNVVARSAFCDEAIVSLNSDINPSVGNETIV